MIDHEHDSRRDSPLAGSRVPRIAVALVAGAALIAGSITILDASAAPRRGTSPATATTPTALVDAASLAADGFAAIESARATGDPSFYAGADAAIEQALDLDPLHPAALAGAGALAAARHEFVDAERTARQALEIDPEHAAALGVLSDAQIELGQYPAAFETLDRLLRLHPGVSSYTRAAYAFELQGSPADAIRALQLGSDATTSPGALAFTNFHIGELHRTSGRPSRARASYRRAIQADPTSILGPHGLARLTAASGNYPSAIAEYRVLAERIPLPEIIIELADLCSLTGDRACVSDQLALLDVQEQLLRANRVNIDLEQTLFNTTRGRNLSSGLALLRSEWRERKSIAVADALAWSLHVKGRDREALRYADIALRLGTRNAMFLTHRGLIKRSLGMRAGARRDLETASRFGPLPFWDARIRSALANL